VFDVGPELVELDMDELEGGEEPTVEFSAVIAAAGEPGADGGFADPEYFFESGSIDTQCQQMKRRADGFGMRFQAIEDGVFAAGELCFAGLAT
jgi:hypothetical protein